MIKNKQHFYEVYPQAEAAEVTTRGEAIKLAKRVAKALKQERLKLMGTQLYPTGEFYA